MSKQKISAIEIMNMIPDEELAKLAEDTKVDYCAKVLTGMRVFFLLVYAFMREDRLTQRKIGGLFACKSFRTLFNVSAGMGKVSHSSISARLASIDLSFFEKAHALIYGRLAVLYSDKELAGKNIIRIDSSMVAETCNKLVDGLVVGGKSKSGKPDRRQVKYTVAYDGFGARLAEVLTENRFLSEDMAMPEAWRPLLGGIKESKDHANIYVMDRGLSSLSNFTELGGKATFVGRLKTGRRMEAVESLMDAETDRDLGALELVDDMRVRLFDNGRRAFSDTEFRVVRARFKEERDTMRNPAKGKYRRVENEVLLITNDFSMTAQEVAAAYRGRWDIEVFFKFLKQNLSLSHFISTNPSGIKVILYMTLITAMLIMIYKRENNMYYSEAKSMFVIELENWIFDYVQAIKAASGEAATNANATKPRVP